ncbi:sodium-coupled neutral amino acid transporter 9-like [Pseudomyrmex gracilis]|uniref:sodium-coupled neutral amino acid transporter 9-like n=1 Tax=Pseudomyrmex gracilis TaxID=219809 RepID=UPI000994F6A9|nr:sodium-coupled neutral amino acid transporter 9-like [Pseudomyrmex gracilis]XP_020289766.1 sodium-coupled neutral amino acid transporter 9-like [Pseudomyrmex gracilis]XP_020289767.1 sodium-coupled neutral amino acid transporter 9-like [Pseudomyrmex gracilis]XP_020289769.1 sodium-coupled neutral amino acid transporter 9-like [Pseudomyrmex gracilis]XP_020289770.1 sodium-coupled neutral amino acid transporter 9-like [Pseudomyrmex gracilis]XP_020289771.1 sodium-coupled neutral amino acid transp
MYKSRNYREENSSRDSGSESTPLLSSEPRTSPEPVIFGDDTETSDLDLSRNHSLKYRNIDANGYGTTVVTSVLKRPPLLTRDNELLVPAAANPPCTVNLVHEKKNYDPRGIDLIRINNVLDAKRNYAREKLREANLLGNSSHIQQDARISGKDCPKQSSLVTIFSIWNTILGSSLLTMPWGIAMAGFFPGIIFNLIMSGLCLYTAYRLITTHAYHGGGEHIEVIELCRIYLGKWAEYIAQIFSIAVLTGATVAYWVLMTNFLYNSVNFIYDNVSGRSTHSVSENMTYAEVLCPKKDIHVNDTIVIHEKTFDALGPAWDLHNTVPVFLALLIFPFLNFNSTTFFTKFNSLGTVSIVYVVIFVLIKSASWGINMDQHDWATSTVLQPTFPALTGILAMSFFIHNIIITVMQSNRNQEKNGRDLTIAYILVTLTYIIVGAVFFMCFPLAKSCIEDNLLNNFQKWDGLTIGARILLLFQLMTVYPLLAYMLRIQLLSSMCKEVTKRHWILVINLILVFVCILFATFMPYIGTIVRYTGALSGLIYVFTLPSLLHLSILRKEGKLTVCSLVIHLSIPVIGVSNLIAQFFIIDH